MQVKVMNEAGFQILTSAMSIGPSQTGYVLEVSADGKNFSPLFAVAANTTKMATGLAPNAYYRLKGNVGEVIVNWSRSCVIEGGSGSGASYTAGDYIDITEDIISVTGITPDAYLTSADTANFALSADVATLSAATVGKADAASVSANRNVSRWPAWNEQGIITGTVGHIGYESSMGINNNIAWFWRSGAEGNLPNIYAPTSKGSAGDILVSTGGTPIWSAATFAQQSDLNALSGAVETLSGATTGISSNLNTLSAATESAIATIPENPVQSLSIDTIWKGTQAEYDAATESGATADPNTFYIIVAE